MRDETKKKKTEISPETILEDHDIHIQTLAQHLRQLVKAPVLDRCALICFSTRGTDCPKVGTAPSPMCMTHTESIPCKNPVS